MKIKISMIYQLILVASIFKIQGQDKIYLNSFNLLDVRPLGFPFKQALYLNVETLLKYNIDRLFAPYLKVAGLTPIAKNYPNLESDGFDGHMGGLYFSVMVIHYASTGNVECKARMDSRIIELKKCQEANFTNPDFVGYVGGVPNGKTIWLKIIPWILWYYISKFVLTFFLSIQFIFYNL